jgi:hypothetical protein
MNDVPPDLMGIPVQYQVYATWGVIAAKYLSEFYSSVRAGGGLRRILMAFWFGEQLPKVIAKDYEKELTTPPFPSKQ